MNRNARGSLRWLRKIKPGSAILRTDCNPPRVFLKTTRGYWVSDTGLPWSDEMLASDGKYRLLYKKRRPRLLGHSASLLIVDEAQMTEGVLNA